MDARHFYQKEILRNGLEAIIRAARPEDAGRIVEAFKGLEAGSIYTRFFAPKKEITEAELQRFREIDFDTRVTLLTTIERAGKEIVIASGTYVKVSEDTAEVAFVVEEDYQRLGIAKLLLTHLGKIALAKGIKYLSADVLSDNSAMVGVFKRCGWPRHSETSGGVTHITLDIGQA